MFLIYDALTLFEYSVFLDDIEGRTELNRMRLDPLNAAYVLCGAKAEALEQCREHASKNSEQHLERIAYINSLPTVVGSEMTQVEWDECMIGLTPAQRGEAANLAAHSWATVPHPNGILIVNHRQGERQCALLLARDGGREWVYDNQVPRICYTCKWAGTDFRERGKNICRISKKDSRHETRITLPTQTCSGWQKWEPKNA